MLARKTMKNHDNTGSDLVDALAACVIALLCYVVLSKLWAVGARTGVPAWQAWLECHGWM